MFLSTQNLEFLMQEWQDNAGLLRRITGATASNSNAQPIEHTKLPRHGLLIASHADTFTQSLPYAQQPFPSSPPFFQSGCTVDLPCATLSPGLRVRNPGHTQCRDPGVDTSRGILPGSAF